MTAIRSSATVAQGCTLTVPKHPHVAAPESDFSREIPANAAKLPIAAKRETHGRSPDKSHAARNNSNATPVHSNQGEPSRPGSTGGSVTS
jgi:hypothetical protein